MSAVVQVFKKKKNDVDINVPVRGVLDLKTIK